MDTRVALIGIIARPVWSGGKSGDNFKGLPITISRNLVVLRAYWLYPL